MRGTLQTCVPAFCRRRQARRLGCAERLHRSMMNAQVLLCLLALVLLARPAALGNTPRSFVIDYENNRFLKDGQPIQIVAGGIHYFRTLPQQWDDRLTTMKAAGLNAIQTYVEWSSHEPEEGRYDFEGPQDLMHFLNLAQSHDFLVLLRIGPYICAERDLGGLPYWLLSRNASIRFRTMDPEYTKPVERYFSKLLPLLQPLLYVNGGPIVAVQIENEYGSYKACDFEYMAWLRDLVRRYLHYDVILYTTDGAADSFLKCGKVDGVYTTVDFGPTEDPEKMFAVQRRHQERGPLMNSEYYTGWLDHWAEPHSTVSTAAVAAGLDRILSMNASVALYMFHGGTSFGVKSGANVDRYGFHPTPTSYDYDAPMTEAGDPTDKFRAIRDVISKHLPVPQVPVPEPKKKMALGKVPLRKLYDLKALRQLLVDARIPYIRPLSFERIRQSQGLVLYETWVNFLPRNPAALSVPGLRDRGYVYVDDAYQGIISRMDNVYSVVIPVTKGQRLTILVESQGRVGFIDLNDPKGLGSNVTLSGITLSHWNMTPIDTRDHLAAQRHPDDDVLSWKTTKPSSTSCGMPSPGLAVYQATFKLNVTTPLDTFIRLDHWKKGIVVLNGFNLGRYWTPMGPQKTLYVPAVLFKEQNLLDIVELEQAPCGQDSADCYVQFVDTPDINGTVPLSTQK
ncbi:beta-galactosidase-like [Dermacentor silvarum]|uniref:beta-galactosidase-like n=1 Tax=Dermacentor silvarum TaxID=543639 RepID=UPI0021007FF8|nr:beta-galactosidase-like [Dermacentor silvarum]